MTTYIVSVCLLTLLVLPVAVRVGRWLSDWNLDAPSKYGALNETQLADLLRRYP